MPTTNFNINSNLRGLANLMLALYNNANTGVAHDVRSSIHRRIEDKIDQIRAVEFTLRNMVIYNFISRDNHHGIK